MGKLSVVRTGDRLSETWDGEEAVELSEPSAPACASQGSRLCSIIPVLPSLGRGRSPTGLIRA
jgi:hypothetical protein